MARVITAGHPGTIRRAVIAMKLRAHLPLLISLLPVAALAATAEPKFDHYIRLTPENSAIENFPAQKAAILTVKSGAIVKIDTGGGAGWRGAKVDPDRWLKQNGVPTTMASNVALRNCGGAGEDPALCGHRAGICSLGRSLLKARCLAIRLSCESCPVAAAHSLRHYGSLTWDAALRPLDSERPPQQGHCTRPQTECRAVRAWRGSAAWVRSWA